MCGLAMTLMLMAARRASDGEKGFMKAGTDGVHGLIGTKVLVKRLHRRFRRIGQKMAKRAHFGFGMKIIVQNRSKVAQTYRAV